MSSSQLPAARISKLTDDASNKLLDPEDVPPALAPSESELLHHFSEQDDNSTPIPEDGATFSDPSTEKGFCSGTEAYWYKDLDFSNLPRR